MIVLCTGCRIHNDGKHLSSNIGGKFILIMRNVQRSNERKYYHCFGVINVAFKTIRLGISNIWKHD